MIWTGKELKDWKSKSQSKRNKKQNKTLFEPLHMAVDHRQIATRWNEGIPCSAS